MKAGIIGAGGYAGGELLRLLLGHPEVREVVAGSESLAGKPVTAAHPNLRTRTDLQFVRYEDVSRGDVLSKAAPRRSSIFRATIDSGIRPTTRGGTASRIRTRTRSAAGSTAFRSSIATR